MGFPVRSVGARPPQERRAEQFHPMRFIPLWIAEWLVFRLLQSQAKKQKEARSLPSAVSDG